MAPRLHRQEFSVVGLQYRVLKPTLRELTQMVPFKVKLVREPENVHDPNAIAVVIADKGIPFNKMKIGYLRRQVAEILAQPIDEEKLVLVKAKMLDVFPEEGEGLVEIWLNQKGKLPLDKLPSAR